MDEYDIKRITDRVFARLRRTFGLSREKVEKCVRAVVNLDDEEINQKLKKLI